MPAEGGGGAFPVTVAGGGADLLRVGAENRVVELTQEQATATSFSSVLSLPALLDELPAQLAAAVGG